MSQEQITKDIETIIKADKEVVEALEDGPIKQQIYEVREVAEEVKEGEGHQRVSKDG